MKNTVAALVAVATIGGSLMAGTPAAQADGRGVAAGVAAGLIGGAIVGGAYVAGPPGPPPGCYWSRERFWDGYGWRSRPVQVCN
jgi:hypothetical protein